MWMTLYKGAIERVCMVSISYYRREIYHNLMRRFLEMNEIFTLQTESLPELLLQKKYSTPLVQESLRIQKCCFKIELKYRSIRD